MAGDRARYRLWAPGAAGPSESGEGLVVLTADELTVTAPAGLPLRIPLRDLQSVDAADYVLRLALASGDILELSQLGKRFDAIARELTATRRTHFDAALLLEEDGTGTEDHGAFRRRAADGSAGPERTCAVRPQRTSLAILCEGERPFIVPYGAVKDVAFDPDAYAVVLALWEGGAFELLRLGKRTDAVRRALADAVVALAGRNARALAALAPDVPALRVRALAGVLRDGVPASSDAIEAAAPGAWEAMWARSFAGGRRPYAEALAGRAGRRWLCVKELAVAASPPQDASPPGPGDATGAADAPASTLPPECDGRRLLYAFELGDALALEAPGSEDVATYVFRAGADAAARVPELCRAFAAVQFRREPIYLPEEQLGSGPHARYREVVRLVPELRDARAAFLGRALHSSEQAWREGLENALARAKR